jgi:hypothetical protein
MDINGRAYTIGFIIMIITLLFGLMLVCILRIKVQHFSEIAATLPACTDTRELDTKYIICQLENDDCYDSESLCLKKIILESKCNYIPYNKRIEKEKKCKSLLKPVEQL